MTTPRKLSQRNAYRLGRAASLVVPLEQSQVLEASPFQPAHLEQGFYPYCDNGHASKCLAIFKAAVGGGWAAFPGDSGHVPVSDPAPNEKPRDRIFVQRCGAPIPGDRPHCVSTFQHNAAWIDRQMEVGASKAPGQILPMPMRSGPSLSSWAW